MSCAVHEHHLKFISDVLMMLLSSGYKMLVFSLKKKRVSQIIQSRSLSCSSHTCPLQAREERNYHVFYELLAGLNDWDKQELYLQGAETYYYLNQVHGTNKEILDFSLVTAHLLFLHCIFQCLTRGWFL